MNRFKKLGVGVVATALALSGAAVGAATAMPDNGPGNAVEAGKKKKVKVKVKAWPGTMTYGVPAVAEGKLKGKGVKRKKVVLQRKVPGGGWKTVGKDKTSKRGKFAIVVGTPFYTPGMKHRVKLKRGKAHSKSMKITVLPNYVPSGTPDSWARISKYKHQYNPCKPVTYRVNLNGMDATAFNDVQEAIARTSIASGIRFKYKGATDVVAFDGKNNHPKDTNLIISFATDAETVQSFANASAWGGSEKSVWGRSAKYGRVALVKKSGVVVDKANPYITPGADGYRPDIGYTGSRVQILQHEIGHAAGLGHRLDRPGEIMSYNAGYTWGAGDLTGLSKVGYTSGCVKPIKYNRKASYRGVDTPPEVALD